MTLQDALHESRAFPQIRVIYNGDELSSRLKSLSTISHDYETLLVGGCSLDLIWDESLLAGFMAVDGDGDDANTFIGKAGRIDLYLNDADGMPLKAQNGEPLHVTVFKGKGGEPKFSGKVLQLPLTDRFDALSDIKPGSESQPLRDLPSNPADLVLSLLTTYAGYDAQNGAANPDIDHSSWSQWRDVCAAARLELAVKLDGSDDLKEILGTIAELSLSAIYAGRDGKLYFDKRRPGELASPTMTFDSDSILSLSMEKVSSKLVNQVTVASGYKLEGDKESWGEEVVHERLNSQAKYDKKAKKFKNETVWHKSALSAAHLAKGLLDMYEEPFTQVSFDLPLEGVLLSPGQVIRIKHDLFGCDDLFRVLRIQENLAAGKVTVKARETAIESDWSWSYIYSANTMPEAEKDFPAWQGLNQGRFVDVHEDYQIWQASADLHERVSPAVVCQGKNTVNWRFCVEGGGVGQVVHSAWIEEFGDAACSVRLGERTQLFTRSLNNPRVEQFVDDGVYNLRSGTAAIRVGQSIVCSNHGGAAPLGRGLGYKLSFSPLGKEQGKGCVRIASPVSYRKDSCLSPGSVGNTVELSANVLATDGLAPFVFALADGSRELKVKLTAPTNGYKTLRLGLKDGEPPTLWLNAQKKLAADWSSLPGLSVAVTESSAERVLWGFDEGVGRGQAELDYLKICKYGYYDGDHHAAYPPLPSPSDTPPHVENLKLGRLSRLLPDGRYQPQLKVSFVKPASWPHDLTYLIYYRCQSEGQASVYALQGETSATEYVIPASPGLNWVKVVAKRANGVAASFDTAPEAFMSELGRPYIAKVESLQASATNEGDIKLTWLPVTASDADILDYEIRTDENFGGQDEGLVAKVRSLECLYKAPKVGQHTLFVRAHDIWGYYAGESAAAQVCVERPYKVSAVTKQVIDNNVLLRWTGTPTTFPIREYVIRRARPGAAAVEFARITGTFHTAFESVSGNYEYSITAVDMAGNESLPESVAVVVSEPPDFRLITDFAAQPEFSGTKTNAVVDRQMLFMPVDVVETWNDRAGRFASPQAQIEAGQPYYIKALDADGGYEQIFDLGTAIPLGRVHAELEWDQVEGVVRPESLLALSNDGKTWQTPQLGREIIGNDFRFIRFTLSAAADHGAFAALRSVKLFCDVRLKTEDGRGLSLAGPSGGVEVNFRTKFIDITSLTVTAQGSTPLSAIYDFTDEPYPTKFFVYVFNQAGQQVAAPFSWVAKGY